MNNTPKLLLLSGASGSGKDECAKLLMEMYPSIDIYRFGIADSVKEVLKRYMLWDGIKDGRFRKLAQTVGQAGRDYDKNVWVRKIIPKIELVYGYNKDAIIVITDIRFENEIDIIKNSFPNGHIVVARIGGRSNNLGELANNISEHALDSYPFPIHIDNSGTLCDLKQELSRVVKSERLIITDKIHCTSA